MNSNFQTHLQLLNISNFLRSIEQSMKETVPGKYFSVSFNGKDTIVCSVAGKTMYSIINVDLIFASNVSEFLEDKNFTIQKFRNNPYAFEATYKRNRPPMM